MFLCVSTYFLDWCRCCYSWWWMKMLFASWSRRRVGCCFLLQSLHSSGRAWPAGGLQINCKGVVLTWRNHLQIGNHAFMLGHCSCFFWKKRGNNNARSSCFLLFHRRLCLVRQFKEEASCLHFVSMGYSYLGKKSSCAGYIAREKACRKLNRNRGQIKTDLHSLVRPSAYNSCLRSEKKGWISTSLAHQVGHQRERRQHGMLSSARIG